MNCQKCNKALWLSQNQAKYDTNALTTSRRKRYTCIRIINSVLLFLLRQLMPITNYNTVRIKPTQHYTEYLFKFRTDILILLIV